MITFVMYVPGSKGKFVTEICDLLLTDHFNKVNVTSAGFVSWANKIGYQFDGHINGIFPEEIHYQEYIKKVTDKVANKQNIHIDTHYTNIETLNYLLENNHKVIFISTTVDDIIELAENFFYKNFIGPFYGKVDVQQKTEQVKKLLTNNHSIIKSINDEEFNLVKEYFSKPFHQWSRECYDICYKMSEYSCGPAKSNPKDITHDNFLYLDYKNLGEQSTLQSIANLMSNGVINKSARIRFNQYTNSQEFGTYNEFIEKFMLDFSDKSIV